jgi:uncharacterized protein (TIGR02996 family)
MGMKGKFINGDLAWKMYFLGKHSMNDHEPFLQAIIAEPEDDAPRLVYSDWLEERGHPRAEFIRVQCALARGEGTSRLRAEWREREEELLAAHRAQWLKPLRGFGRCLHFRRGFVEKMNMTAVKFLERGETLFRLAPIRALRIMDIESRMPTLAACPSLRYLRELSFTNHGFSLTGLRLLSSSPHLVSLTSLSLFSTNLEAPGLRILLEGRRLPRLTELDLGANRFGAVGAETLAGWSGAHRLSFLDLSFNHLGDRGLAALANSLYLNNLAFFSLCQNEIGDVGVRALADSAQFAKLETLSLRRNRIGIDGARALAASPFLARLTRLDLAGNDLDPDAQQVLKARFASRVSFR